MEVFRKLIIISVLTAAIYQYSYAGGDVCVSIKQNKHDFKTKSIDNHTAPVVSKEA